ncbi:stage VI sporulation protein F [Sediminibacillus massiliensis]|uniref:stage VI sporulation protein F n=1 Tax=Sediminibacillus massiliensis TaxID=1926277 RepID=UPI0009889125|nr:stage VI sporulation protein F [Sediminibacillus massiliensis]
MSDFQKNLFDQIQKKSSVKPDDIFKVADSVKNADFSDEKTVRRLVRQLARMADKPISKEKEDKIVKAITSNNMPTDMSTLGNLFKK